MMVKQRKLREAKADIMSNYARRKHAVGPSTITTEAGCYTVCMHQGQCIIPSMNPNVFAIENITITTAERLLVTR